MNIYLPLFLFAVLVPQQDAADSLKKENAKLKAQVRTLQKQLESARANGFLWDKKDAVSSMLPLMKQLPDDLKLQRSEFWDKFELEKVNEEFRQSNNRPFAARQKVSIEIRSSNKPELFKVKVRAEPDDFSYKGHNFRLLYGMNSLSAYEFVVDGATKSKLEKLNTTKAVPVTGLITDINLRPPSVGFSRKVFSVYLKRLTIAGIALGH